MLAPAKSDAAAGIELPPEVIVKQSVQAIPLAPLKVPARGLVFGHSRVSEYWLFSWLSIVSLLF